ncbi:MAG TPA: ATP-binding protein [Burkholderiaceae bacterium]
MYSIIPAFVSALFLSFGFYALSIKGVSRVSLSFFLFCFTTAAWQGMWAILFQTTQPALVALLARAGYVMILYLPTCFYLLVIEVCNKGGDRRYIFWSYLLASALVVPLLTGPYFVAGEFHYFFGPYPKAGPLHSVHLIQTFVIIGRCYWITLQRWHGTRGRERAQIRLCIIGFVIYTFAAIDYLCNYGLEIYPPGVVFLAASAACFAWVIIRYDLMNPYNLAYGLAASVAHEMRSPLVAMKLLCDELAESLPTLIEAHKDRAQREENDPASLEKSHERIAAIPHKIVFALRQSTATIDKFLAVTRGVDTSLFARYSIERTVNNALHEYPFAGNERDLFQFGPGENFDYFGSNELLVFVLFNLIKNAQWAIKAARKGEVRITTYTKGKSNVLQFADTALGIDADTLPYIFDEFFSTKHSSGGTGVGLSFCSQVMKAFGGSISCESEKGSYTRFLLEFPVLNEP